MYVGLAIRTHGKEVVLHGVARHLAAMGHRATGRPYPVAVPQQVAVAVHQVVCARGCFGRVGGECVQGVQAALTGCPL